MKKKMVSKMSKKRYGISIDYTTNYTIKAPALGR